MLTDDAVDRAAAALAVALNGGFWSHSYSASQREMWRDRVRKMMGETVDDKPWTLPPVADRPYGFRCLAFHRGKWHDVVWISNHRVWMTHTGSGFFRDEDRLFAPLPPLPEGCEDQFWDWGR